MTWAKSSISACVGSNQSLLPSHAHSTHMCPSGGTSTFPALKDMHVCPSGHSAAWASAPRPSVCFPGTPSNVQTQHILGTPIGALVGNMLRLDRSGTRPAVEYWRCRHDPSFQTPTHHAPEPGREDAGAWDGGAMCSRSYAPRLGDEIKRTPSKMWRCVAGSAQRRIGLIEAPLDQPLRRAFAICV